MYGAVFIDYLCEMTFKSRLRSVWPSNLDPLSKGLQTLLFPEH